MAKAATHLTNHSQYSIGDLIEQSGFGIQQAKVVALCVIFNMIDGFDITAMAVVAGALGDEMQLAEDKLGLVFSFSLAGMMIGAMFLASLSDLYGRRSVIIASLLCVGSTVVATAYANNLYFLIALRFLSGLGAGAMLASQAALAAEYSPEKYRALSVSLVTAGYPLGAMATGLLAGPIIDEFGWRGMFLFGGTVTLGLCFIAFLFLPESIEYLFKKRPRHALERINKILISLGSSSLDTLGESTKDNDTADAGPGTGVFSNISMLLAKSHRKKTISLWVAFFLAMVSMYFLMSWIPKLLTNAGYSAQTGNYAFSMYNFGGVAGIFLLGVLATRWKLSLLVSGFMLGAAISMWVFAAVNANEIVVLILIAVIGVFLQGGFTGLYALAAKIYPCEIRSTGVGFAIGIGRMGAVLGPAAAGYLIAGGVSMQVNFVIFAIPMLASGIYAYLLKVK